MAFKRQQLRYLCFLLVKRMVGKLYDNKNIKITWPYLYSVLGNIVKQKFVPIARYKVWLELQSGLNKSTGPTFWL